MRPWLLIAIAAFFAPLMVALAAIIATGKVHAYFSLGSAFEHAFHFDVGTPPHWIVLRFSFARFFGRLRFNYTTQHHDRSRSKPIAQGFIGESDACGFDFLYGRVDVLHRRQYANRLQTKTSTRGIKIGEKYQLLSFSDFLAFAQAHGFNF